MTDEQITKVAEVLRKRLSAATPEEYQFTWQIIFSIYAELDAWFLETDPDYLPQGFFDSIFEDYTPGLYG